MKSELFGLNWKDALNGAIRATIISFLTTIIVVLNAGTIEFTWSFWQPTVIVLAIAFFGSLLKSWTTNSEGDFATGEPPVKKK